VFDYKTLQKTATNLISNFGVSASITRDEGRRFDPASGKYFTGLTVTYSLKAVRAQFNTLEKAGDGVKDTDVRILAQSGITVPIINDTLTFDSVQYRVMGVKTESPSGTDVFYDLHCRV
jgi:hypothetical protein|tara:strand:+ start:739 stop:1095 length:357 start_codon:yes stop_codon:yes gene_type:complete